ncbi:MAG: sensor domain-containing diguanylate cyclase [Anaerolineales bacterium]|nr:sensor domain-containing diguanylate cyclase [Anaerolineales bacterium]
MLHQLRAGRILIAGRVLVYALWALMMISILTSDGVRGSSVLGQFLLVVLSGLLVSESTTLILAVLSIGGNYIAMLLEDGPGLLLAGNQLSLPTYWALQAGYLLLALGLVMLFTRTRRATLAEQQSSQDALLDHVDELREAKARLEISQRDLRRREEVLAALRDTAELLLRDGSFDVAAGQMLRDLGTAIEVERVFLYENYTGSDGRLCARMRHEWHGPHAAPRKRPIGGRWFCYEEVGFGHWPEVLQADRAIKGNAMDFPEPARGLLQARGVLSLMAVPIFLGQEWWGFIGFDQSRREREWSPAEEDALRGAGGILGGAIERLRVEAALNRSEMRYLGILQDQFDLICRFKPDGKLIFANDSYLRFFGLQRKDFEHLSVWDYLQPEHHELLRKRMASLTPERPVITTHILTRRMDGARVWVDWTERAFFNEAGELQEIQTVGRDVNEQMRLRKQLEENLARTENLAMTDELTGLLNRRAIMEHAEAEWQRAEREGSALSLVLLDVDHLKAINDTYGHLVGDQALSHIAEVMRGGMRRYDWAGRWGGDEFLLILPGAENSVAVQVAERLRVRLSAPSLLGGQGLEMRASLGVASKAPRAEDSLEHLLARADEALYEAKQAGRDRVASIGHARPGAHI